MNIGQQLGWILLKALPTFILFYLLHFYLRAMYFGPMAKVLREREKATSGAKRTAEKSLLTAESKAAEFEKKIDEVRAQLAKEREATRKGWLDAQATRLAEARTAAEAKIVAGKSQVLAEAAAARQSLESETAKLADEITASVLRRSA